jgi:hypothetical protein
MKVHVLVMSFALVLMVTVNITSNATEIKTDNISDEKTLRETISEFIQFPYSFMDEKTKKVSVKFLVDAESKVKVLTVSGDNLFLAKHIKTKLDGKLLKVNDTLLGKKYSVDILFEYYE